jgi:hypothetical protein
MRQRRPRSLRSREPCHERLIRLERAGLAVLLARKEDHRAVLCHPVAWLVESAVVFPQLFGAGADIKIELQIEGEVAAREGPVRALGLDRSVSHAVRSRARPLATRPSRPSRSPHRQPDVTGSRRTVQPFGRASSWPRQLPLGEWRSSPRRPQSLHASARRSRGPLLC